MKPELLLFSLIAISFVATLVRSTFGFGESLVAVPLFVLVVVVQDHRKIHFRSAKWLILSSIPGIPIGLMILVYGNGYRGVHSGRY
jgi:hypothetical protein